MSESHYAAEAAEKAGSASKKLTAPDIRSRKSTGTPIVAVTAYDVLMARLIDAAGVDIVLVGDSLGMVFQGLSNTLPVTLDEVCYHGRAVARAKLHAHLVGDMPFMSYQVSVPQAVESAGKMLKEGAFESVKLEGGADMAEQVRSITRSGIPVMGHLGLQPQSVHLLGGFKVQARTAETTAKILADARALEQAGVYAIVLEAVPPDVARQVTGAVTVPTIGIGAGPHCNGQILVCTDLLGLSPAPGPKFAKRYAELGADAVEAVRRFATDVRAGAFPADEHAYAAAPSTSRSAPKS
jgi:3-methyl-2-oxobutanoate hydroxymethyltransferase